MRRSIALAAAVLFACSFPALADTLTVFNAQGSFVDGATLSGTITMDTTAGTITGVHLLASGPDNLDLTNLGGYNGPNPLQANYYGIAVVTPTSYLPQIALGLDTTTLMGYAGGDLFSRVYASGVYGPSFIQQSDLSTIDLQVGTLTPESGVVATAPEPSALMLFGTGVLALAGAARRRRAI